MMSANLGASLGALALGAAMALSSCTASEAAAPAPEAAVPEQVVDAEVTTPTVVPPSDQPITLIGQYFAPDFEYAGELTQGGWIKGSVPYGTVSAMLGDQELKVDDKDREFFAAFDRDSALKLQLSAKLANGETYAETINIAPRKWQISRINVNRGRGRNLEAYWKKREPEYNAIVAARAKKTGAQGWKQEFIWPVKGRISGYFGRQRVYRDEAGSYHSGIDIAPGNGVPFVSPADGVVVLARSGFSFEGKLLIVDHGAGLNSAFLHCSKIAVKEGDVVKQGQYIGNVGSTGRSTGPHLHWGVKWGDARFDPILLVGPMK